MVGTCVRHAGDGEGGHSTNKLEQGKCTVESTGGGR